MKSNKLIIFLVNGNPVEEIEGDEIDFNGVENMKTNLAIIHGVAYDEVEVDTKDIETQELSDCFVRFGGGLMYHPKRNTYPIYVQLPVPAMDISEEEKFYNFLDLIVKGDIDNAITFS